MKVSFFSLVISISFLIGCSTKKSEQTQLTDSVQHMLARQATLTDSIDRVIKIFDNRLDIKMKRKTYTPQPGTLVTIQKWFEYGDTTRLVKLREETITNDTKIEVFQYHFINSKLAETHDFQYNKNCGNLKKQCMNEGLYYFSNDKLAVAKKRDAIGRVDSVPVIERAAFLIFYPDTATGTIHKNKIAQINKKYSSLPFPKPHS